MLLPVHRLTIDPCGREISNNAVTNTKHILVALGGLTFSDVVKEHVEEWSRYNPGLSWIDFLMVNILVLSIQEFL